MNTKTLQEHYPSIYQNFFNKYDLVISTALTQKFSWICSNFLTKTNSLSYKLPLKIYIWINPKKKNCWPIKFTYKNNSQKEFTKGYLNYFYQFNHTILDELDANFDIGFLTEHTQVDPSIIAWLIGAAKLMINNSISPKDLTKFDINNPQHQDKLQQLLKFFSYYKKPLSKFLNTTEFIEDNLWFSMIKANSFLLFERTNKWIFSFHNFNKTKYFHNLKLSSYIINTNIPTHNTYEKDIIIEDNNIIKKFLEKNTCYQYQDNLIKCLENIERYFSLELFKNISDIYDNKIKWQTFFTNLNNYKHILDSFFNNKGIHYKHKQEVIKLISKQVNKNFSPESHITSFIDENIKIWTTKNIKITKHHIDKINKENNFNITLDYSSFQDGYGTDGIQIEQYTSQSIHSNFVSQYILKTIIQKKIEQQWTEYEKVIQETSNCLLLDTISNKIYLYWQKLTSKDILSQTGTIEILKILIDNIWKEIINRTFPPSSYSKNKNEMVWKIIIPLTKFIKNRTWIALPFTCTGSLWEFSVKLNPSSLPINIVEKTRKN